MKKVFSSIKEHALISSVILILFLISVNTGIIYYNNWVLKKTTQIKLESERAIFLTGQIWNQVVRNVDVGMRGFALTKNESLLGPLKDGIRDKEKIFDELRSLTKRQGFLNKVAIDSMSLGADMFIAKTNAMVDLVRIDSMTLFHKALNDDPGRDAWLVYSRNAAFINDFENAINQKAQAEYKSANASTVIFQTLIFIIAIPTLLFMIMKIVKDRRARRNLFAKLEKNNRDFIFNPGTDVEVNNENEIIDNSIKNFKNGHSFYKPGLQRKFCCGMGGGE